MSTEVNTFRKEAHDFIDNSQDKVLSNYNFIGKILKNGKVRGRRRNTWLEDDVMKWIWIEGNR